jgi:hypothetical protein
MAKNTNVEYGCMIKFIFFKKTIHEMLHLHDVKFCTVKYHGHAYRIYLYIICLLNLLNTELKRNFDIVLVLLLCVEFCSFVHCHVSVNYVTFC